MTVPASDIGKAPRRGLVMAFASVALAILLALGTWQVQRLAWKEGLIATINERIAAPPKPLAEVEQQFAATGDVDYVPVQTAGRFLHAGESHFFATWEGQSGYYVYTPLQLADARVVLVNRGFVPFDRKDPATRPQGQIEGDVAVTGLARNPLSEKPSSILPDNEPAKNIFYWKDRDAMVAHAGLGVDVQVLPFFIDLTKGEVPGGLPVGGVTMVEVPNNHLQYAITWYGLAAALVGVVGAWLWRGRKG